MVKKESIWELMTEQVLADEILTRKVTKLGNSGHVPIPSKHIGKEAKIIIKNTNNEEESEKD